MIPGIVAAAGGESSGGSGNPYSDTLAVADFLLGLYFIGEEQTTAAAMIDRPGLIDSSGLLLQWDTAGGYVRAIGDFGATLALMNWTMVIEWTEVASGSMYPLEFFGGTALTEFFYIESRSSDLKIGVFDQPEPGANRAAENFSVGARPATRRMAVTRTDAKLVASVNGSAIVSDTVASNHPYHDDFFIGGHDSGFARMKGYLRRIIVYPVKSDSELPALSTQ